MYVLLRVYKGENPTPVDAATFDRMPFFEQRSILSGLADKNNLGPSTDRLGFHYQDAFITQSMIYPGIRDQKWTAHYSFAVRTHGQRSPSITRVFDTYGLNLYTYIRELGANSGLGKYQRLDLDPQSMTVGHHLFEHGTIKIHTETRKG